MKKILYIFLFITLFVSKLTLSFALSLPEDVFNDIKSDYKYYTELKTILQNSVIKESTSFEPLKLITKKDFVLELSLINPKWNYQKYVLPKNENDNISIPDAINIITQVEKIKNDYILLETKNDWTTTEYKLYDLQKWKMPTRYMNREDLLRMSYIVFTLNKEIFLQNNLVSDNTFLEKDCSFDKDDDWINDCNDACSDIKWSILNNWCPILEKSCNSNCSCSSWYTCSSNNENTCSKLWVCLPVESLPENKCLYENKKVLLFWNTICDSTFCTLKGYRDNNFLNFISSLRKCDSIFWAISSPDKTEIYWSWSLFEIR